ncbi:MAG: hypothetical protein ABIQ93_00155 [Saprospiraceae bacterium]
MNRNILLLFIGLTRLVPSFAQMPSGTSKEHVLFFVSVDSSNYLLTQKHPTNVDSFEYGLVARNVEAINSPQKEFAPVYYENGLVFASTGRLGILQRSGEGYSNLYFSPFDPNGNPTIPQMFSLSLTSPKNEGPVTFSRDFKTIYYTQNNNKNGVAKAGKDGKVHLKIYWATAGDRDWERHGALPFCSADYSCLSPSLSMDGKRLYFASDMPGGFGGYDLYFSELDASGSWTSPVNLGPNINTDQDDLSPFISQTGTLFFASAGHNSLGGRDLFFSNATPDGFSTIVNLGSPFNTPANESSIILDAEEGSGFFVSEREHGFGKSDIYRFTKEFVRK